MQTGDRSQEQLRAQGVLVVSGLTYAGWKVDVDVAERYRVHSPSAFDDLVAGMTKKEAMQTGDSAQLRVLDVNKAKCDHASDPSASDVLLAKMQKTLVGSGLHKQIQQEQIQPPDPLWLTTLQFHRDQQMWQAWMQAQITQSSSTTIQQPHSNTEKDGSMRGIEGKGNGASSANPKKRGKGQSSGGKRRKLCGVQAEGKRTVDDAHDKTESSYDSDELNAISAENPNMVKSSAKNTPLGMARRQIHGLMPGKNAPQKYRKMMMMYLNGFFPPTKETDCPEYAKDIVLDPYDKNGINSNHGGHPFTVEDGAAVNNRDNINSHRSPREVFDFSVATLFNGWMAPYFKRGWNVDGEVTEAQVAGADFRVSSMQTVAMVEKECLSIVMQALKLNEGRSPENLITNPISMLKSLEIRHSIFKIYALMSSIDELADQTSKVRQTSVINMGKEAYFAMLRNPESDTLSDASVVRNKANKNGDREQDKEKKSIAMKDVLLKQKLTGVGQSYMDLHKAVQEYTAAIPTPLGGSPQ